MTPKRKLTVSLSVDDMKLLTELGRLTGAYSASEVVRDAIRLAYKKAIVTGAVPRPSEERIP
jgi:Arc/MetJ-type ribon-helix-helix transcriptional regulator